MMLFKCHGYTVAFRRSYKNISNHIFRKSMLDFAFLNFPAYSGVCEEEMGRARQEEKSITGLRKAG